MANDSEKGKYSSPEGSSTWEYLSVVFCAFGYLCLGTLLGWNSPTLIKLMAPDSPIPVTAAQASSVTAAVFAGSASAPIVSAFLIDRIGRKNTILVSTLPMMITWLLILIADNITVLIAARVVAGIPMGTLLSTMPMYIGEIASKERRGAFLSIKIIAFHVGVLFMFGVAPHFGVKTMAGIGLAITMTFAVSFTFVPKSPYYLVMRGRIEDAEVALEKLRGKTDVTEEMELIQATIRERGKALFKSDEMEPTKAQSAISKIFKIRGNLKAFGLEMILTTLQYYSGLLTILSYCAVILNAIGSTIDVYASSIAFSVLQIIAATVCASIADKFGRRPLIFFSGLASAACLMTIATYFFLMEYTKIDVTPYGIVPLVAIFLLVVMLNVGVLPIPGILIGEIFAPDVKAVGSCIVMIFGSLLSMFATKSYFLIATTWNLGHSIPFLSYGITSFLCVIILMRFLPETKGKTFLQIQRELNA